MNKVKKIVKYFFVISEILLKILKGIEKYDMMKSE